MLSADMQLERLGGFLPRRKFVLCVVAKCENLLLKPTPPNLYSSWIDVLSSKGCLGQLSAFFWGHSGS